MFVSVYLCYIGYPEVEETPTPEETQEETQGTGDRALSRLRLLSLAAAAAKQPPPQGAPAKAVGRKKGDSLAQIDRREEPQRDALSLGLLGPPRVYRHSICLSPEETEKERKEREQRQMEAQEQLEREIERDPKLEAYIHTKHRFFDPLFKRRRLSFLDRLARSRIKSQMEREIGAEVYVQHPDKQASFPSNKGLLTRKWPSPYH